MTNPNDAIGTNAGLGGRTSPNAFNDGLAAWSRGIMSGWACSPKSGMTVQIGGDDSFFQGPFCLPDLDVRLFEVELKALDIVALLSFGLFELAARVLEVR